MIRILKSRERPRFCWPTLRCQLLQSDMKFPNPSGTKNQNKPKQTKQTKQIKNKKTKTKQKTKTKTKTKTKNKTNNPLTYNLVEGSWLEHVGPKRTGMPKKQRARLPYQARLLFLPLPYQVYLDSRVERQFLQWQCPDPYLSWGMISVSALGHTFLSFSWTWTIGF